ncbi:hypothetical protein [Pseudomonas sp. MWU12-2345]|uniref:hypothetical protein n=1 Tax=Pseudomonas sp. MWU12-2345 TaxID=2928689 RepID=UPI00200EB33E|nr:hypothetical protein [Pseudomonas sp. MWU12-2345]
MNLKIFIERAKRLCTETTPTILKADEPTGETPMELFIIDDHTTHYLSFKTGEESFLGKITGIVFLIFTPPFLIMALLFLLSGDWEDALLPFAVAVTVFPISFYGNLANTFHRPFYSTGARGKFISITEESYFIPLGMTFRPSPMSSKFSPPILVACKAPLWKYSFADWVNQKMR